MARTRRFSVIFAEVQWHPCKSPCGHRVRLFKSTLYFNCLFSLFEVAVMAGCGNVSGEEGGGVGGGGGAGVSSVRLVSSVQLEMSAFFCVLGSSSDPSDYHSHALVEACTYHKADSDLDLHSKLQLYEKNTIFCTQFLAKFLKCFYLVCVNLIMLPYAVG